MSSLVNMHVSYYVSLLLFTTLLLPDLVQSIHAIQHQSTATLVAYILVTTHRLLRSTRPYTFLTFCIHTEHENSTVIFSCTYTPVQLSS
jgi:hypothetical protein